MPALRAILLLEMIEASDAYVAVIEDDDGLRRSLARLLRAAGYRPVTYRSAEMYLDEASPPKFECLVVDIQLDGMSGIQLGEHLAAAGSTLPVIFITAHEDREDLRQIIRVPFADLLGKDEPSARLFAAIEKATHFARPTSRASR